MSFSVQGFRCFVLSRCCPQFVFGVQAPMATTKGADDNWKREADQHSWDSADNFITMQQ